VKTIQSLLTGAALLAPIAFASPARAADKVGRECFKASEAAVSSISEKKFRAALAQRIACAASRCPGSIRKECEREVERITGLIPTLLFDAKDRRGRDLSEVRVIMDGELIVEKLQGLAVQVDPGQHSFEFQTEGEEPLSLQLLVHEAEKQRRVPIRFGPPEPAEPAPVVLPVAPVVAAPAVSAKLDEESNHGLGTQRSLALVAGGVGLVGVAVGTVFGLRSMSKHNEAERACPGECSDSSGAELWSDARANGTVSTIAFAVGGATLAGGVVLWLTAPNQSAGDGGLKFAVGPGSVAMTGTWW